jgi:hypothetical protein
VAASRCTPERRRAKFDSSLGHLWSRRFGDSSTDTGTAVAFSSGGDVVATGSFYGSVDFGGGSLSSSGGPDMFLAWLDGDGNHLVSQSFGDVDYQYSVTLALDPWDNVVVGGYFGGIVDFGGGPVMATDGSDGFLVKFSPAGAHIWSRLLPNDGYLYLMSVATDDLGNTFCAGGFEGLLNLGGAGLQAAGGTDVFVAKFEP